MAHLQKIVPDKQPRKARDKKVKQKLDPPDVGNEVSGIGQLSFSENFLIS